jgi:UDP-N-acetylglucosamine:LPS N-acetylglucosamine transferase
MASSSHSARPRVLAISSGGGHWIQLQRLLPAFEGLDLAVATVHPPREDHASLTRFYKIPEATRWNRLGLLRLAAQVLYILLRERPQFVVSTGAACGYLALRMAKWLGARCIWVDSIANADELSLSGSRIGPSADLWLTQWEHLARDTGPEYHGSVL